MHHCLQMTPSPRHNNEATTIMIIHLVFDSSPFLLFFALGVGVVVLPAWLVEVILGVVCAVVVVVVVVRAEVDLGMHSLVSRMKERYISAG